MGDTRLRYEIHVEDHLAPSRLRNFEGLAITLEADGSTVMVGTFRDQAALYGLLYWLQSLGTVLLLVRRLDGRIARPSPGMEMAPRSTDCGCKSRTREFDQGLAAAVAERA